MQDSDCEFGLQSRTARQVNEYRRSAFIPCVYPLTSNLLKPLSCLLLLFLIIDVTVLSPATKSNSQYGSWRRKETSLPAMSFFSVLLLCLSSKASSCFRWYSISSQAFCCTTRLSRLCCLLWMSILMCRGCGFRHGKGPFCKVGMTKPGVGRGWKVNGTIAKA